MYVMEEYRTVYNWALKCSNVMELCVCMLSVSLKLIYSCYKRIRKVCLDSICGPFNKTVTLAI